MTDPIGAAGPNRRCPECRHEWTEFDVDDETTCEVCGWTGPTAEARQ